MSKQQQTDEEFIESIAVKIIKRIHGDSGNELFTFAEVDERDISIGVDWFGAEGKIVKTIVPKIAKPKPFLDVVYESCEGMTRDEQLEHKSNIVRHLRRYADEIEKWEVSP